MAGQLLSSKTVQTKRKVCNMNKYLEDFYSQICHIDVLQAFNNYKGIKKIHKELTESIGCFSAATEVLQLDPAEERLVFVVGDGKYPRTATMLSFRTRWTCVSVDPELDLGWFKKFKDYKESLNQQVKRLELVSDLVENLHNSLSQESIQKFRDFKKFLVVLPHSHATIKSTLQEFSKIFGEEQETAMVSLPCCVSTPPQYKTLEFINKNGYVGYTDMNVISPKNHFDCWENISYLNLRKKKND